MTGLDFSGPAVAAARELATRTAADAQFVPGDVYSAPDLLGQGEFGLVYTETHEWNHGLAEIITALMDAGLELTALAEHDSAPWAPFPGMMEKSAEGEWRLADRPWRLPCTYTLQASDAAELETHEHPGREQAQARRGAEAAAG